jgi:tRNA threonylcarbamoyl adenosine modification protein YeaZ
MKMKILALEFSAPQRSVAIVNKDKVFEIVETSARHTDAFGMIEKVLRAAQIERQEIKCLAIGLGPGSYHGIRAAIALAQGWQLANGVKILGISSAEAVAAEAQAEGLSGKVRVVIDAQRKEFYSAQYEISPAECREIAPLRIATMAEVLNYEAGNEVLIGPEATQWFGTAKIVSPRATTVGKLAAPRSDFVTGDRLEPIYLRETTFVKAPPLRVIVEK